jgi:hypothetical protein
MDFEQFQNLVLKNYRQQILESNNNFLEIHKSFFKNYLDDITNLKREVIYENHDAKTPEKIWKATINHYSDLRLKLVELKEKQHQQIIQPFLSEFKETFTSLLDEVPAKYETSFIIDKFKPENSDRYFRRQKKKCSLLFYHFSNVVSRIFRRKKRFLESGRKIFPQNFVHLYLFIPLAQYMIDRWNQQKETSELLSIFG